jgi:hypothetical protein
MQRANPINNVVEIPFSLFRLEAQQSTEFDYAGICVMLSLLSTDLCSQECHVAGREHAIVAPKLCTYGKGNKYFRKQSNCRPKYTVGHKEMSSIFADS